VSLANPEWMLDDSGHLLEAAAIARRLAVGLFFVTAGLERQGRRISTDWRDGLDPGMVRRARRLLRTAVRWALRAGGPEGFEEAARATRALVRTVRWDELITQQGLECVVALTRRSGTVEALRLGLAAADSITATYEDPMLSSHHEDLCWSAATALLSAGNADDQADALKLMSWVALTARLGEGWDPQDWSGRWKHRADSLQPPPAEERPSYGLYGCILSEGRIKGGARGLSIAADAAQNLCQLGPGGLDGADRHGHRAEAIVLGERSGTPEGLATAALCLLSEMTARTAQGRLAEAQVAGRRATELGERAASPIGCDWASRAAEALGDLALARGEGGQARADWVDAVRLAALGGEVGRDHALGHRIGDKLRGSLAAEGRGNEAQAEIDRMLALLPETGEPKTSYWDSLAWLEERRREARRELIAVRRAGTGHEVPVMRWMGAVARTGLALARWRHGSLLRSGGTREAWAVLARAHYLASDDATPGGAALAARIAPHLALALLIASEYGRLGELVSFTLDVARRPGSSRIARAAAAVAIANSPPIPPGRTRRGIELGIGSGRSIGLAAAAELLLREASWTKSVGKRCGLLREGFRVGRASRTKEGMEAASLAALELARLATKPLGPGRAEVEALVREGIDLGRDSSTPTARRAVKDLEELAGEAGIEFETEDDRIGRLVAEEYDSRGDARNEPVDAFFLWLNDRIGQAAPSDPRR
jgi:hypothetical protein